MFDVVCVGYRDFVSKAGKSIHMVYYQHLTPHDGVIGDEVGACINPFDYPFEVGNTYCIAVRNGFLSGVLEK